MNYSSIHFSTINVPHCWGRGGPPPGGPPGGPPPGRGGIPGIPMGGRIPGGMPCGGIPGRPGGGPIGGRMGGGIPGLGPPAAGGGIPGRTGYGGMPPTPWGRGCIAPGAGPPTPIAGPARPCGACIAGAATATPLPAAFPRPGPAYNKDKPGQLHCTHHAPLSYQRPRDGSKCSRSSPWQFVLLSRVLCPLAVDLQPLVTRFLHPSEAASLGLSSLLSAIAPLSLVSTRSSRRRSRAFHGSDGSHLFSSFFRRDFPRLHAISNDQIHVFVERQKPIGLVATSVSGRIATQRFRRVQAWSFARTFPPFVFHRSR